MANLNPNTSGAISPLGSPNAAQSGGGTAAGTTADILLNQILSSIVIAIDSETAIYAAIAGLPPPVTVPSTRMGGGVRNGR